MPLTLPPRDSELRECFDIADLAGQQWATLAEARHSAKRGFSPGVRALFYLVLRANGEVQLIRFGPRGGKKIMWRFGQAPSAAPATH